MSKDSMETSEPAEALSLAIRQKTDMEQNDETMESGNSHSDQTLDAVDATAQSVKRKRDGVRDPAMPVKRQKMHMQQNGDRPTRGRQFWTRRTIARISAISWFRQQVSQNPDLSHSRIEDLTAKASGTRQDQRGANNS